MKTITTKYYKCQRTGEIFEHAEMARASENFLIPAKLDLLKKRIHSGGYWVPEVGDYIYVRTSLFIDHGQDDVVGGLAEVTRAYESMSCGDSKCIFVETMQHSNGGGNWTQSLFREQGRLMEEYGESFAYPDPDYRDYYDPHEWS